MAWRAACEQDASSTTDINILSPDRSRRVIRRKRVGVLQMQYPV